MQVFKLCLKILKRNMPIMLIYNIVFITMAVMMAFASEREQGKSALFTQEKINIAFIDRDRSVLADGLRQELEKVAGFTDVPDRKEALQDALYFRAVTYIVRIPEGFAEAFMSGENAQIEKIAVPDSYNSAYIDLTINKYLNLARLYAKHAKNISQESIVLRLREYLSRSSQVETKTSAKTRQDKNFLKYYFNVVPYALLYVLIHGIAELMRVFNDDDLKKRNACSPLSPYRFNLQLFMASIAFTFFTWFSVILLGFILNFKNDINLNIIYFILNSFVFAICSACISFLIGSLVKSRGAISAANNIVTLGLCFIGGIFVPQEFMGNFILKIASFTPTYWFVRANIKIAELAQFDFASLKDVVYAILMQLGFALAFLAIAMAIAKNKARYAYGDAGR